VSRVCSPPVAGWSLKKKRPQHCRGQSHCGCLQVQLFSSVFVPNPPVTLAGFSLDSCMRSAASFWPSLANNSPRVPSPFFPNFRGANRGRWNSAGAGRQARVEGARTYQPALCFLGAAFFGEVFSDLVAGVVFS
jgi:hypothetical protein